MKSTTIPRDPDTISTVADEVFATKIRPVLRDEDDGKYVAIDIDTADYEIDTDDYAAVTRLRLRRPDAEIWLERAGRSTAYTIRSSR